MTVYLDHNATTPVHREVLEAMLPCFREKAGNASALHESGRAARRAVETARGLVADLVGAQPDEILFTAGGTEANNLALRGCVAARRERGRHVLVSAIEHPAVLRVAEQLAREGCDVETVPVGADGCVDPAEVESRLRPQTVLVSVMHANNETGIVQPVEAIGAVLAGHPAVFHVDGVQAAGKVPVDVGRLRADLYTLSAHKMYGPQGVGALWVRSGTPLTAILFGGAQEDGLRPGTYNLPGLVGFGAAARLARRSLVEDAGYVQAMRDRLEEGVSRVVREAVVVGRDVPRLPNTANICFPGRDNQALAANLDVLGVEVSTGSACAAADREPSHVHLAMGISRELALSALRFSLGTGTSEADVETAVNALKSVFRRTNGRKKGIVKAALDALTKGDDTA